MVGCADPTACWRQPFPDINAEFRLSSRLGYRPVRNARELHDIVSPRSSIMRNRTSVTLWNSLDLSKK